MLRKVFGKSRSSSSSKASPTSSASSTLDQLHETLEMLEKKERVLQKKISQEVERAKEYTRLKNKRAALQCLKKKKLYESQVDQLGAFQLRVHDQVILLEGAKATTDTVEALRNGAIAMKSMQKAMNINDVDRTMEEINEQTENMKQIQDVLAAPIGSAADFDEDELEAELEDLEEAELEEQLLRPVETQKPIKLPSAPLPTVQPSSKSQMHKNAEEEELAALQAEMAL